MSELLYHGSDEEWDELGGSYPDYSGSLGWGLYLTPDFDFARVFGKYIHTVTSPVPDELVADLSAHGDAMWTYHCGDSLVMGTPGSAPFTFELRDLGTDEVRRYSVLEQCDGTVKHALRDEYIEDNYFLDDPPNDLKTFSDDEAAYAVKLWAAMMALLKEDPDTDPDDAMEDAIENAEWDEVPAWAATVEAAMLDAAANFDEELTKYLEKRLGTEINLDDITNEVIDAGYAAFYLDGYSPGGGEYVIVSDEYLPVNVLKVEKVR